jgi:hypothetical protein
MSSIQAPDIPNQNPMRLSELDFRFDFDSYRHHTNQQNANELA